jgi:hypothetical protein
MTKILYECCVGCGGKNHPPPFNTPQRKRYATTNVLFFRNNFLVQFNNPAK